MASKGYSRINHAFWTGPTGRELRTAGHEVRIIALYLLTGPMSNPFGLYYLPMPTLCHETGSTLQGASKALLRLSELGFAYYDHDSETVFLPAMARFQIGDELKENDHRHKWVHAELTNLSKFPYFDAWYSIYQKAFNLPDKPLGRALEGPWKPLPSNPYPIPIPTQPIEAPLGRGATTNFFDQFWSAYPKRKAKDSARKAFAKRRVDEALLATMLASIETAKKSEGWRKDGGKYIPNPATWLNAGCWEDEFTPEPVDPLQALWDAPPKYYNCNNPLCQEEEDMRAHETKTCPFPYPSDYRDTETTAAVTH